MAASEADLVEAGLRASASIFQQTKKRLRDKDEHVCLDDLKAVKRAGFATLEGAEPCR